MPECHLPPRLLSHRKLDQKQRSEDLNQHSNMGCGQPKHQPHHHVKCPPSIFYSECSPKSSFAHPRAGSRVRRESQFINHVSPHTSTSSRALSTIYLLGAMEVTETEVVDTCPFSSKEPGFPGKTMIMCQHLTRKTSNFLP